MQVWGCDDTRSYITFALISCNVESSQVVLLEFWATKRYIWRAWVQDASYYDL